jgi:hypothetical protein
MSTFAYKKHCAFLEDFRARSTGDCSRVPTTKMWGWVVITGRKENSEWFKKRIFSLRPALLHMYKSE